MYEGIKLYTPAWQRRAQWPAEYNWMFSLHLVPTLRFRRTQVVVGATRLLVYVFQRHGDSATCKLLSPFTRVIRVLSLPYLSLSNFSELSSLWDILVSFVHFFAHACSVSASFLLPSDLSSNSHRSSHCSILRDRCAVRHSFFDYTFQILVLCNSEP